MGRVIAVANQKGGVAKTTTAVNLGIGLAREGKSVLFVDTDPQGSLTASLGYMEPDEIPITLANVLTAVINEEEIDPAGGILHHEEDIDIMPGNIELSALEVVMGNVMSRELILKRKTAMVSWCKIPRWSRSISLCFSSSPETRKRSGTVCITALPQDRPSKARPMRIPRKSRQSLWRSRQHRFRAVL